MKAIIKGGVFTICDDGLNVKLPDFIEDDERN